MSTIRILPSTLVCLVTLIVFPSLSLAESQMKIKYPLANNVATRSSLSCKGLMTTSIYGTTESIEGEVSKGTDQIAITIKNEKTLLFITKASVEVGLAEPAAFNIVYNGDDFLTAVLIHEKMPGFSTFTLNKEKGLAVWAKNEPYSITGRPGGSVIYLYCQ